MSGPLAFIIEDDYDLSNIFAKALESAGYETQITRNGEAALTWLAAETPAVVVLDLHLPRVAGTAILDRIRSDPRFADTQVIVATADARSAEALQDSADLILVKPISFSQLRDLASRLRK